MSDDEDVPEIGAADVAAAMEMRAADAVADLLEKLEVEAANAEKPRFNTHIDIRSIQQDVGPPVVYQPYNSIKATIVVYFKQIHPEVVRDPRRKIMLNPAGKAGYEQWITDGVPNLASALRQYGERLLFAGQVDRLNARGLSKPMQPGAVRTMVYEHYIHAGDEPDPAEKARVDAIIDQATQVVYVWTTYRDRRHLQLFAVRSPN